MSKILPGLGTLLIGAGLAMATPGTSPAQSQPNPPPANTGSSVGAPPAASAPNPGDKAAAAGNDNQAVTTTGANADQPAKGANSFTKGEARHRIQSKGYSHVTGLTKDPNGVWRGSAQKGGQPVNVWLDYKGNVGQQS